MVCPVPHTGREIFWLGIGASIGASIGAYIISRKKRKAPQNSKRCLKVVLTGGPCGGKSSLLHILCKALSAKDYDVYAVPEVPTILIKGGCKYPGIDAIDKLIAFETGLIKLQMQIEESFEHIAASTGRRSVIVMDRGLLDIPAYMPKTLWQQVQTANDTTEKELAKRYDLVLHLVTAANGAEKYYTTLNNDARTETADEARDLDTKILENWQRTHTHVLEINNEGNFEDKCKIGTDMALKYVEAKFR